jgi:ribosomal protein S18 acetylase RimI-like enzyme
MTPNDPARTARLSLWARLRRALSPPAEDHPRTLFSDVEYRIRTLEEADLSALEWDGEYVRFRNLFRQAYEEMRGGVRLILILEHLQPPSVIGQIFIQWNSADPRLADGFARGYLYALRVKPEYRGRGLGTRLLQAAEQELLDRRMQAASIGVEKSNLRARALYERLGYRLIGEDPGRWSYIDHMGMKQNVSEPAWLMEKTLVPSGKQITQTGGVTPAA